MVSVCVRVWGGGGGGGGGECVRDCESVNVSEERWEEGGVGVVRRGKGAGP